MKDLLNESYITLVQPALADGATDPNSASVDMTNGGGCESVAFVGCVGTITGSGTVTLQLQRSDDNSTWADVTGASDVATGSAESDKTLMVGAVKGGHRYYRTTLTRAVANSVYGGTVAIQYNSRSLPITQPAVSVTGGTAGTPVTKYSGDVAV